MKNLVPLILAFTFIGFYPIKKVSAQAYLFNKIFKPDTLNIGAPAIITLENGYLVAHTYAAPNNTKGFGISRLNQNGETEWFKHLDYGQEEHVMIGGGVLCNTPDGLFMLVGSKGAVPLLSGGNRDILMIKFDIEGNVIWKKTNGEPDRIENAYHITPTQDGGYIMCGIQRTFSSSNRFYVLKTDAFGNKVWDNTYSSGVKGVALSILETTTGYIVSGYRNMPLSQMYVIQIDTMGILQWEKTYGNNSNDNTGCYIASKDENSYIIGGAVRESGVLKTFIGEGRIDQMGDLAWEKTYSFSHYIDLIPLVLTDNLGFLVATAYINQSGNFTTQIMRFTATGDTLWTRSIPDINATDNWYLKDIASTPDGGYIFSGFNYSQQSSWVVKTDSMGYTCNYIGCDSTVVLEVMPGIPSNSNPEVAAMVYPVPASTHLFIRYQIPASILPSGGAVWRLYDALGRQVAEETLQGSTGTEQVPIEHLPAGIYYYRVVLPSSGQTMASGKVVLE